MNTKSVSLPQPPADLGYCADCKFYCKTHEDKYIFTAQGPVLASQYQAEIVQGQRAIVPANLQVKSAPCAWGPHWELVSPNGWCWRWEKL